MKRLVSAIALCSVSVVAHAEIHAPKISSATMGKLAAGEILVTTSTTDKGANRAEMLAIVHAPLELLEPIVSNFAKADAWTSHIRKPKVQNETNGDDGRRFECSAVTPVPVFGDRNWTAQCHYRMASIDGQNAFVASWEYIPGSGNIKDTRGYWILLPVGDGSKTLIQYIIEADLGLPLPGPVTQWVTKQMLPQAIKGLEKVCDCIPGDLRHD